MPKNGVPQEYWEQESDEKLAQSVYAIVGDEVLFTPTFDPNSWRPYCGYQCDSIKRVRSRVLDRILGSNKRAIFGLLIAQTSPKKQTDLRRYRWYCEQYQQELYRNQGEMNPQLQQMKFFLQDQSSVLSKTVFLEEDVYPDFMDELQSVMKNDW